MSVKFQDSNSREQVTNIKKKPKSLIPQFDSSE